MNVFAVWEGPFWLYLWFWTAWMFQSVCCAQSHELCVGVSDHCCQCPGLLSTANGSPLLFLTLGSSTVSTGHTNTTIPHVLYCTYIFLLIT